MRQIASHWCANRQTNDSLRVTFACNNEKTNVIRLILIFAVFVRDTQLFQAWKFGYYGCSRYSERSYVHDYIDSKIHKNLPLQSSVVLKSELFEDWKKKSYPEIRNYSRYTITRHHEGQQLIAWRCRYACTWRTCLKGFWLLSDLRFTIVSEDGFARLF